MPRRKKPKFETFDAKGSVYLELRDRACVPDADDEDDLYGYLPNGVCARIRLQEQHKVVRVQIAAVTGAMRRQKIGTAMYERAAKLACERFGKPLASDFQRSTSAGGFWRKQLLKGRATEEHGAGGSYYMLTCPAPKSLAGLQRRSSRKEGSAWQAHSSSRRRFSRFSSSSRRRTRRR